MGCGGFRAGTCDVEGKQQDPSISWVGKNNLLEVWFVALERHFLFLIFLTKSNTGNSSNTNV